MDRETVLSIKNLTISFAAPSGQVKAVRGLNLELLRGETLAVVGESGSGKSVTARAIMGILDRNGTVEDGSILFTYHRNGEKIQEDLCKLDRKTMRRRINGKRIAMVFQDPSSSLTPTLTIGRQLMEGMRYHLKLGRQEAYERAVHLLELVGITQAERRMKCYPHQLSGGMCQRVVIAIALSCGPELLICDEPTTALDVTIQARILELIAEIQQKTGISVLYITHDLGVVAKVADRVDILYAGKVVETGLAGEIFYDPRHPYTWGLLSAIPDQEAEDGELYTIPGNPPDPADELAGDAFARRSAWALNIDYRLEPPMFQITDTHYAATWLLHEQAPKAEMPERLKERIARMRLDQEPDEAAGNRGREVRPDEQ